MSEDKANAEKRVLEAARQFSHPVSEHRNGKITMTTYDHDAAKVLRDAVEALEALDNPPDPAAELLEKLKRWLVPEGWSSHDMADVPVLQLLRTFAADAAKLAYEDAATIAFRNGYPDLARDIRSRATEARR